MLIQIGCLVDMIAKSRQKKKMRAGAARFTFR
jgi:hypothetical protein